MDDLHRQLTDFVQGKNQRIWGPAVWVPDIEDAPWDARVLTLADPFGDHLRFNEPNDPSTHATLPDWSAGAGARPRRRKRAFDGPS